MSARRTSVHGAPASRTSSIAASAGLGVFTAVIGYLVSYVLIASEVRDQVGGSVPEWKGVAWYYYSAHMVDIEGVGEVFGFSGSRTVSLIAQSGSTSAQLLYVVPPLVLLLAGAALAYHWRVDDIGEAVLVGAPVTIGYFLVVAIGAVVSESSGEFFGISTSISPEFAPALLLAGILYPLVFATAGAVVTSLATSR